MLHLNVKIHEIFFLKKSANLKKKIKQMEQHSTASLSVEIISEPLKTKPRRLPIYKTYLSYLKEKLWSVFMRGEEASPPVFCSERNIWSFHHGQWDQTFTGWCLEMSILTPGELLFSEKNSSSLWLYQISSDPHFGLNSKTIENFYAFNYL